MPKKIIFLAGPPKAGKSQLSLGLYNLLRKERASFFREQLSPDCEGIYALGSASALDIARSHKNVLKAKGLFFTNGFVERKLKAVKSLPRAFEVVYFDLGGIPSDQE